MARARHVCNETLGISRAPTAYALFCAHAKANWKTPARRRIKQKSSILTKSALQKKWETMPEDEKEKFKQDAAQRAARNKLLRESAAHEKRVRSAFQSRLALLQSPRRFSQGPKRISFASHSALRPCLWVRNWGKAHMGRSWLRQAAQDCSLLSK